MKNIYILPTKLSSDFFINEEGILSESYPLKRKSAVHIYITSDEEIKEGWYFNKAVGVNKPVYVKNEDVKGLKNVYGENLNHLQKIILTTDQDLIKDGVQAIGDEFLEWFLKNSSCEEVKVEGHIYKGQDETEYKIIIPKEEPEQECCQEVSGYYLGTTCPKCNKPFRSVIEEPFKHEIKVLSKEEVMEGRSSAYKFIDFDKQETLQGKLQSLVVKWHQLQLYYQDVADDNITHEHTNRKFTYKAQATRDCWKELLTLLNEFKNE